MAEEIKSEEERAKHDKKMNGYLSLFNFLLAFLVGYYYGMHFAAILAAVFSLIVGYTRDESPLSLYKQTWALASPYAMVVAVGIINPVVIPVGVAGVLFTALGLHIRSLTQTQSVKFLIMGAALALVVYGGLIEYPKYAQSMLSVEMVEPISNFEVTDLEGNEIQNTSLHGKVVLIDFWATWCKPCRDEFKDLEQVVAHFEGNDNVVFLITNAKGSGDTVQKVRDFANNGTFNLPFYMDLSGSASHAFNVESFPTLALIDKEGNKRLVHTGYSNAEELSSFLVRRIEELIQE